MAYTGNENMYEYIKKQLVDADLLSYEEERELLILAKKGNTNARDKLVKHNSRLAFDLVCNSKHLNHNNFEDLYQVAYMALYTAIDKFDLSYDCKFCTYATYVVKKQLFRYHCHNELPIKVPCSTYGSKKSTLESIRNLMDEGKSLSDVANILNIPIKDIPSYLSIDNNTISLSAVLGEDNESDLETYLSSDDEPLEKVYEEKELNRLLNDLINNAKLNDKEKQVIKYLYLNNNRKITQEEVANIINYKRQYVSCLINSAFKKLRINARTASLATFLGDEKEYLENLEILRNYYVNNNSLQGGLIGVENKEIVKIKRLKK